VDRGGDPAAAGGGVRRVLGRSPDRGVAPEPAAEEPEPDPTDERSTLRATLRPVSA
jgi:hypothetical protein